MYQIYNIIHVGFAQTAAVHWVFALDLNTSCFYKSMQLFVSFSWKGTTGVNLSITVWQCCSSISSHFWVILGLGGALCALSGAPRPRVLFSHRFWEVFWRRLGTIWAPRGSKERLESFKDVVWEGPWRMFGKSSGPKAALWRPRCPKGSKKKHFGCMFCAFFTKSMKTEKCVWTAQACTDCI